MWLPEVKKNDSADKNNLNYYQWVKDGWIEETQGNVIDYEIIYQSIVEMAKKYKIIEIAYDPYNRVQIIPKLEAEGSPLVEHSLWIS